MWVWRMVMMMTRVLTVMVMTRGVFSLPAIKSTTSNDRPIIGILAQEVHGSLADTIGKLLSNEYKFEILSVNRERANNLVRFEYSKEPSPTLTVSQQKEKDYQGEESENSSAELEISTSEVSTTNPTERASSHSILEDSEESINEYSTKETLSLPLASNNSYISASYVKFIEAAGARVVPVFVNRDRDYYEHILKSINGILFPGGAVAIDETSAYGRAGKIIYEIAKEMNDQGEVFPLWGTCLGFELMMGLAAKGREIRTECDAQNTANYLKLDADYADGYLLRHLPKRLLKSITSEPITSNFHHYCVTPKNFTTFGVYKTYRALAYSADRRGIEYIAAAEAWEYPFFAVQFHPEKSSYEWTTKPGHDHIPHSSAAVSTANYFAQVFVNYARRSNHHFADEAEETKSLLYNFSPIYTGQSTTMEQMYIF